MERFRQKRSKITSIADRSFGDGHVFTGKILREGSKQIPKQRNYPKLASDSSSCSSSTTEEDLLMFELRRRSSERGTGTPMKKLLAEEMSKESESKRRSPSVIARLMGLDGLPPQQPAHKQQKRLSQNYQQRTASVGSQKGDAPYEGHSLRKSSKEQQEFKDVFEVLETTKVEGGNYPLQWTANSRLTEAEMAFIRQKFMDAKRLSTDEKLQDSKEFHDALEVLDSNKDLLLKFLQEPDSLFTKHLHDLQGSPQSHCGRVAVRKAADAPKHENNGIGLKSDRETPCKNYISSPLKHRDGFLSHSYSRGTHNALKSSKIRIEGKDEASSLPTRIVVLKPNLGKVQDVAKSIPSPHSSHAFRSDCGMNPEFLSVKSRESELWGRKNFSDDVGLSRHKSRESREIAKEITRKMRDGFSTGSMNFSSGFRGYAGDESSCYASGNDSANESDATTLTSRNSVDWNNRHRHSPSHSSDSSVNREAKKRLSERWKMTHGVQEAGVAGRASTLGEMLAIPDKGMKPEDLKPVIGQDGSRKRFASLDATTGWVDPLGISSRDGWKDSCIKNLPRSRSLPASSTALRSPKMSPRCETLGDDRYLVPKEAMNRGRNRATRGNLNQKEGSFSKNLRTHSKKSQSSCHSDKEGNDILQEVHLCQNQVKIIKAEEDDPSEQKPMVSEASVCNVSYAGLVLDGVVDVEHEKMTISSVSPKELIPGPTACMSAKGDSSTHDVDNSISQEPSDGASEEGFVPVNCPLLEPESPVSSKEPDQPSPVSILEAPFTDDPSSGSECFESLNADLQGLRMQLQLLKLESEAYAEGPMAISSDEDVEEGSVGVSEEKGILRAEESWESSYVVDMLIDSGFNDSDPDTFMETWHSLDCPVGPLLFEKLEKKYCDLTTSLRCERRLLFDRINSGLVEIFQRFMDPHPWVKPLANRVGLKRNKEGLEDDLCKLLTSQEKKANKDVAEKMLGKESQWLELGDDIDIIGGELERLLIDELVAEVVNM